MLKTVFLGHRTSSPFHIVQGFIEYPQRVVILWSLSDLARHLEYLSIVRVLIILFLYLLFGRLLRRNSDFDFFLCRGLFLNCLGFLVNPLIIILLPSYDLLFDSFFDLNGWLFLKRRFFILFLFRF
jgi:hypothetical protein